MTEEEKKKIDEIKSEITCKKDFECVNSGFENLCKAKDIGLKKYLDCLKSSPQSCQFALSFGKGYLCRCPLRIYIKKRIGK